MADSRKQKLICLGSETLAEALLDIAVHFDAVDDPPVSGWMSPQLKIETRGH